MLYANKNAENLLHHEDQLKSKSIYDFVEVDRLEGHACSRAPTDHHG